MLANPPHSTQAFALTTRRGGFWIPGDPVTWHGMTVQRGPMWVEWEAPDTITRPHPIVLVHGGGGQGTDWLVTPDGRPGWAREFVAAGFAVYVVDRPGHGRSPHHPDVLGPVGSPGSAEMTVGVFAPPPLAEAQTQWIGGRDTADAIVSQLTASAGFLLADFAEATRLDGVRLASLLRMIGPAVLITHSVGAVGGWLAANLVPDGVAAIVAVEPMGPPNLEVPGMGALTWGLTATPFSTPEAASPSDLDGLPVPGIAGTRIAIVTGSASPMAAAAPAIAVWLRSHGGEADLLPLGEAGISGNGHGLMFEANSTVTASRVIRWLESLQ